MSNEWSKLTAESFFSQLKAITPPYLGSFRYFMHGIWNKSFLLNPLVDNCDAFFLRGSTLFDDLFFSDSWKNTKVKLLENTKVKLSIYNKIGFWTVVSNLKNDIMNDFEIISFLIEIYYFLYSFTHNLLTTYYLKQRLQSYQNL